MRGCPCSKDGQGQQCILGILQGPPTNRGQPQAKTEGFRLLCDLQVAIAQSGGSPHSGGTSIPQKNTHTNFLCVITGFTRDPFQGAVDSWISRRRASRLAAQQMQHRRWESEHARSFFGYWGHAARYDSQESIPIATMLRVRGPEWLFANYDLVRRRPGRWPDASRLLQLAWENLHANQPHVAGCVLDRRSPR